MTDENNIEFPETEIVEICPLCDSNESEFLFWNFDRLHRLPGKFGLVSCKKCSLVRLSPRPIPSKIGFYYPKEEYYSYQAPADLVNRGKLNQLRDNLRASVFQKIGYPTSKLNFWQSVFQPIIVKLFYKSATYGFGDRFPRYVKNGKALDIGCGNAIFLSHLKRHGWQVSGVDLSPDAAETAKKNFNIDVFVGNVEDANFEKESFDYINLSHSIEHLPNPVETLKSISSLLKPTGIICIETPNANSFNFKKLKGYWIHTDTPRHLFLFSPKTLSKSLNMAGFEVTQQTTKAYSAYEWKDTYEQEDEVKAKLEQRPKMRKSSSLRSLSHNIATHVSHIFFADNGDAIQMWASKKDN